MMVGLKTGDTAPDFKLKCSTEETQGEFQLSSLKGKKNVVILFYPLDFTPVCQSELAGFQAELAKLAGADAEVVGVSTDTVFSHIAFQKELGGVSFPLATDRWPYAETAKAYGIFPPSRHGIPFVNDRAIFIVDKQGKIAWSKIYEIGTKPLPSEVLEALSKIS